MATRGGFGDEEKRQLHDLWERYTDDLPGSLSPVRTPPDRLSHLNPEVRSLLGEMSAEDARTLREALRFYRNAHAVSRFMRWLALAIALALGGGAAFGDHIANMVKTIFGGKHP